MTIKDETYNATYAASDEQDYTTGYEDSESTAKYSDGKVTQGNGGTIKSKVNTSLLVLGGLGAGALLMFFFDPQQGRRRRALVRDKAVKVKNKTADVIEKRSRDLSNRAQGVIAQTKNALSKKAEGGSQAGDGQIKDQQTKQEQSGTQTQTREENMAQPSSI